MKTPNLDIDAFVEALRGDLPSAADEARVRARLLGAGVVVGGAALSTSSGAASLAGSTSGAAAAVPGAALTQGAALSKAALTNAALSNAALSKAVSGAGVGAGGLGAGVTAGGIGAAGAPAAVLKAGLLSKIVVLPVAAKVGVATTLALAVAATSVPLLSHDQPTANRPAAAPNAPAAARSAPEPKSVVSGALPNTRRSLSASSPAQDVAAEDVAAPDSNARASRVARSDGAIAAPPAVSATEAQQMAAAPSDLTAQRPERDVVASDAAAPRARSRSANTRTRSSARSGTSKTRGGAEGARDHEPVAASAYEPSSASAPEPAAGETASASDSTLASGRTEWVRASQLAEETRLIEQALVALGDGDPSLARRSLEEHARRFPDGLLTRERERARARVRELDAHRR